MYLDKFIDKIFPLDGKSMLKCKQKWNSIAKPIHGLGALEDYLVQIAGILKTEQLPTLRKALVIMCADNGVVAEGVTQTGQEVTAIVADSFVHGKASVNYMADQAGVDVFPLDAGMVSDTIVPSVKTARGSGNILREPAMTREAAVQTILMGIKQAGELKKKGYHLLALGEMGIGNTTTSSAVAAVLLDKPAEEVTGTGAGLDQEKLKVKIRVIQDAVAARCPDRTDPIDVLAKLGGYDIAGLAGLCIGGAYWRMPVILDGFITSVAALAASRITPLVRSYLIPSHQSAEPAARYILEELHTEAPLHLGMHLGEGTGAVALCPLLDMALSVYQHMNTFEEIDIEPYETKGGC